MKVTVWVSKNLSVEVDGEDNKSIFKGISDAQSLFEDSCCGACKSENIKFQVRQVEDNEFYELVCKDCWAKLGYGHAKTGGKMYAKRMEVDNKGKAVKDDNGKGKPLPHKGWCKYNKETGKNE